MTSQSEPKQKYDARPIRIGGLFKLSFREEVGNAVSHGVTAAILLLLLPVCAVYGYIKNGIPLAAGYSVFIISLFLMFLTSCLYHSMSFDSKHKMVFRILDHSAIFVAIAGTFTPICLHVVGGWLGILVLVLQWTATIAGILYKALALKTKSRASVIIYLVMGWSGLLLVPSLIRHRHLAFMMMILLGGIFYSIGTLFYAAKDKGWHHLIWHMFIILAAVCHFVAIIFLI